MAAVVFTGGALLAALAPTVWVLIAARVIIGLAVGSAALVVPLYLSEIAPTEVRGAITSLNQMMIVCGILAAFIVNAILASSGDWRLMLGLAAVPSLVLLVGMLFMPETPRYLVHAGEEETAHSVLEELPGDDLARCQQVTASSFVPGDEPVAAVDGSPATPWVATSPQGTLTVQLAKRTNISSVTIDRGGTATNFAYAVGTSTDGSTWQTVANVPASSTGTDQITLKPTQAQYVRLDFPGASGADVPDVDKVSVG